MIEQGINHLEQGNYQGAIDDFSAVIVQERDILTAYLNRGKAHAALGNTYLAVANSQRAAILAQFQEDENLYQISTAQVQEITSSQNSEYIFALPWLVLAVEEEQNFFPGDKSEFVFWGDVIQIPGALTLPGFGITSTSESDPLTVGLLNSGLIYLRGTGTITRTEGGKSIRLPF